MADRNSYDTGASGEVQGAINRLSGQISTLIATHRKDVQTAFEHSRDYSFAVMPA